MTHNYYTLLGVSPGARPIPTSYFVDQQGKVRYIRVGELTAADVEQVFRQMQTGTDQAHSE